MPRTLLLDLDGTLIDTVPALTTALNLLDPTPRFTAGEVAPLVGTSLTAALDRACAARRQMASPELIKAFLTHYRTHVVARSRVYNDVIPTLRGMVANGWTLAVCTEQPEEMAHLLLNGLGFAGLIGALAGADTFGASKPDPQHLLATLAAADGEVEQAVMVGDHAEDVTAARNAGIACIFARWGYGKPHMAAGASALAMTFSDVHGLAARLLVQAEV